MKNARINPVAKSVFLCDAVIIDEHSGKPSIVGLFNSLPLEFLPNSLSIIEEFCVFFDFVGGVAESIIRVEICDPRSDTVVFRTADRVVRFSGRHTTVAVNFRLKDIAIPDPGDYIIEVYCNNEFVDDRLLRITALKEGGS